MSLPHDVALCDGLLPKETQLNGHPHLLWSIDCPTRETCRRYLAAHTEDQNERTSWVAHFHAPSETCTDYMPEKNNMRTKNDDTPLTGEDYARKYDQSDSAGIAMRLNSIADDIDGDPEHDETWQSALLREAAKRIDAHGSPNDEPNANGTTHARLYWWKARCDELHETTPPPKSAESFYRETLEQIASDRRKTRAQRLASSALSFWDAMREHTDAIGAQSKPDFARPLTLSEIEEIMTAKPDNHP